VTIDMDDTVAAALLAEARDARQAMRRQEGASAIERFEGRYPDIREAMDWCLAHGRVGDADAFASALVPFWMATKRLDDGREWFARALAGDVTEQHDEAFNAVSDGLSPEAVVAARARGATMSLEEAVAFALAEA
jgi:hypothetical protein